MNGFVGITWELGSVRYTGLDIDGWPIAQHDGLGTKPQVGSYELHHAFGFISRPRDPDTDKNGKVLPGKACNVLIGKIGNETHLFLASDPRFIPSIPQLKKGGAAVYSAPGSFIVLDGEDGTVTEYIPVPGDKAHILTRGIDGAGKPFIAFEHADGMAITMIDGSMVLKNNAGDAYYELNAAGHTFNGAVKVNGSLISGDPVGAQPVALAPPVAAALGAIAQALTALAGAIDAKMPSTPAGTTAATLSTQLGTISAQLTLLVATKTSGA